MGSSSSSPCVRQLRRSERQELLQGDHYCFALPGRAAVTATELAAVRPEDVWVIAMEGKLCAALEVPQFDQGLRGILTPLGGIAGVWCYPEYRNRGFVRRLMGAAWQQMRSRRLGVSMLYPFSVPYYAQFGYVPAAGYGMVTVPLAAWQGWRSLDSRGWRVRRVPAEGVGAECLAFLRTIAPQNHGWAVPRAGESQWRWWYQQRLCLFLERDGQLDAVALYSLNNGTGTTAGSIKIWLWGWRYEAGRQQLLHFFAQHRDQVSTVTMDVPTQTSVHHGWGTLPHLLPVHMALPWMVRVVDLAHLPAIPLGGASGTPPLAIAISDSLCPWNAGTWLWANQRGNLRCTPAGTSGGQVPPLTATIEAVTALIYGTHTPAELVAQQWLSGDDRSLELLDTWFPPRAFYNPFKF